MYVERERTLCWQGARECLYLPRPRAHLGGRMSARGRRLEVVRAAAARLHAAGRAVGCHALRGGRQGLRACTVVFLAHLSVSTPLHIKARCVSAHLALIQPAAARCPQLPPRRHAGPQQAALPARCPGSSQPRPCSQGAFLRRALQHLCCNWRAGLHTRQQAACKTSCTASSFILGPAAL